MKKLEGLILTYENSQKGVSFKDILGILQEPDVFRDLIFKMSSNQFIKNSDAIIAVDARGFIFGAAISLLTSKPMIVARKPGNYLVNWLKRITSWNMEKIYYRYKKALEKYNSYVIIDDLLATGGTVDCVARIPEKQKKVLGLLTVVELVDLNGKSDLIFSGIYLILSYKTKRISILSGKKI